MKTFNVLQATPEEFKKLNNGNFIFEPQLVESGKSAWFTGKMFGVTVMTDLFDKGEYEL